MLATPGCWACDEIGALLSGVFCGVLDDMVLVMTMMEQRHCRDKEQMQEGNATRESGEYIRRSVGPSVLDGLGHCE